MVWQGVPVFSENLIVQIPANGKSFLYFEFITRLPFATEGWNLFFGLTRIPAVAWSRTFSLQMTVVFYSTYF